MVHHKNITSICAQLGLFWSLMSAIWLHSVSCVFFVFSFSAVFWCQWRNLHWRRKREYLVHRNNGPYHLLQALNTSLHPTRNVCRTLCKYHYRCQEESDMCTDSLPSSNVSEHFIYFMRTGVTSGKNNQWLSMVHSFSSLNICHSRRQKHGHEQPTMLHFVSLLIVEVSELAPCTHQWIAHFVWNQVCILRMEKCGVSAWLWSSSWTCFMW